MLIDSVINIRLHSDKAHDVLVKAGFIDEAVRFNYVVITIRPSTHLTDGGRFTINFQDTVYINSHAVVDVKPSELVDIIYLLKINPNLPTEAYLLPYFIDATNRNRLGKSVAWKHSQLATKDAKPSKSKEK